MPVNKFSVLLSLYHKESPEYFSECMESIANQSIIPNEIIIVFDGDIGYDLEEIVHRFLPILPIKIIRLSENMGLGKALNEGIKYCSYNWIFRMDTDDICLSNRFEKQIEYINSHPNLVLLGTQVDEFDELMKEHIGIKQVPLSKQDIKIFALKRNPFNHMTVAYQKEVIEKVGGYQHHLYMEDYNLWLRVIAKGYDVANLPDALVKVRAGNSMYLRRKGLSYIKSEYTLANLKINLNLQSFCMGYVYFLLRSLPRLLPSALLGKIYHFLRRKL